MKILIHVRNNKNIFSCIDLLYDFINIIDFRIYYLCYTFQKCHLLNYICLEIDVEKLEQIDIIKNNFIKYIEPFNLEYNIYKE